MHFVEQKYKESKMENPTNGFREAELSSYENRKLQTSHQSPRVASPSTKRTKINHHWLNHLQTFHTH